MRGDTLKRSIILSIAAYGFFLSPVIGADDDADDAPKSVLKKACEAKKAIWTDDSTGRKGVFRCIPLTKDVGKHCTDGSQCESSYCVTRITDCKNKLIGNPPVAGLECVKDKSEGSCYGRTLISKGCHELFENGKVVSRCFP